MRICGLNKGVESALWRRRIESLPKLLLNTLGWADDTNVVNAANKRQRRMRVNIAEDRRDERRKGGILRDVGDDREKTPAIVLEETVGPRSFGSHFPRWPIS